MEHNRKANQIIEGLDNAKKAMPSEDFLSKMEYLAESYTSIAEKISLKYIMGIAASFAILVIANISMYGGSNQISINNTEIQSESTYNLVPTKSLYNE